MRRIGFRRLLPLGNLALFLALLYAGAYLQVHQTQPPRVHPVASQEGPEFEWHPPRPSYFPAPWLVAIVLNVPATILGAIAADLMHIGTNFGALMCSSPFLLLLWLFVGRWLDGQIGLLPRKSPGTVATILCVAGIGLAITLFILGLFAVRAHQSFTASFLAFAIGWQLWAMILFLMCLLTLLRKPAARVPAL